MPQKKLTHRIISPIREFISDSRTVGVVLICCTIVSLIISNTSLAENYISFWERDLLKTLPSLHLPHTPLHIINDALMSVFFLLAGMEIKRELLIGELSSIKKSLLPVFAALGGMLVPALIYLLWCGATPFAKGWGIPMATDIAFSLGVLSLLGKRAPVSLRIFLTALAIIDDLGGIITIAVFYAADINMTYLFLALSVVLVLMLMNLFKVKVYILYFLLGLVLWYFVFNSGVHATVAGVLLALTLPLHQINKLEHTLHDPVSFIILPLFALANTAIALPADLDSVFTSVVHYGILTGLVIGKPLGICFFSYIAIKLKFGELPTALNRRHIIGMGLIAGIGFTISIFMTTLAFQNQPVVQTIAKMAIILASILSGILGYTFLRLHNKKTAG